MNDRARSEQGKRMNNARMWGGGGAQLGFSGFVVSEIHFDDFLFLRNTF